MHRSARTSSLRLNACVRLRSLFSDPKWKRLSAKSPRSRVQRKQSAAHRAPMHFGSRLLPQGSSQATPSSPQPSAFSRLPVRSCARVLGPSCSTSIPRLSTLIPKTLRNSYVSVTH